MSYTIQLSERQERQEKSMQLETEQNVPQEYLKPPSQEQGLLFVLSSPSGTGKDSVIHALKKGGMDFYVVASVTTRAPRPGESEGNPYHFVSQKQFMQMVENDELIEYANVYGNWYGQPRQVIRENLRAKRDVLLKIDVQGAATIQDKVPDAIFIFLVPGSLEELAQRLTGRRTETEPELMRRLAEAREELAQQHWYDYVIVNRQSHLQEAVELLRAIMLAEHARTRPRNINI
ncbi:MAG TPA: guanylate kinase [Ktedonobacter sp.]|nr:guanylate kinase [Ktedonobacter sp.]HAT45168.1 guanylate kinase [Ktedonobacter sp.]HBE25811.1 guanylate kinase [Ktedonobacter sp.]HBE29537.1 guanylate kinase [Ktedonobacter sp.]HCF83866.1 guanylate kinase [Ktedonobacter sp.]